MTRSRWMAVLKWVAVAGIVAIVVRKIASQWSDVSAMTASLHVDPLAMSGSAAAVLLSYAVLIWTWQQTVGAWGERLAFAPAARIWFVSNLGRYLPGKVWQIAAMGVMAQRAGVSPVAAVGSSLVIAIVNVVVGIAISVVLGSGNLVPPGIAIAATIGMALAVIATPWIVPAAARFAARLFKRRIEVPSLPHRAIWVAAVGCAFAWLLYGIAFRLLHIAILGATTGTLAGSTAAFTASYLAGFLALFAPGGLGVREWALDPLLARYGIATGAAASLIIVVSRLWLTILEVLPGLVLVAVSRGATKPSPESR